MDYIILDTKTLKCCWKVYDVVSAFIVQIYKIVLLEYTNYLFIFDVLVCS